MVISIAAYPWEKAFWIYDDLCGNKCEKKVCNITVREWEIEKVEEYFEAIVTVVKRPIDEFYLIIYWDYYNEIRKNFVQLSKNYGIKELHIMNEYQLHATVALKYLQQGDSDSLWIFSYSFHVLLCEIWEKSNDKNFKISELLFQRRTNRDPNYVEVDLQNLKNKIHSTAVSPTLVVFQNTQKLPECTFEKLFNNHSKIFFHNCSSIPYDLLQIVQNQKSMEFYHIQSMFGRIIDIKIDDIFIQSFLQRSVVPFETKYNINSKGKNMSLKIYENGALTKTINICEKGKMILDLKIDVNGILNTELTRKRNVFDYLPFPKSESKKNGLIFKIPSKFDDYDKDLNAVGIDLGTSECCAFVIRRNGPDGVVLDPIKTGRTMPSYVAINELNEPCGQNVVNRMERKPEFLAFDSKRLIGKEFDEIVIDPLWPYDVINYCEQIYLLFHDEENIPGIRSSAYISSCLLKQIKEKVEEYQGAILNETVITIPSSFTEKQKDATIDAGNIAGWEIIHLLPEPIAALIAYSFEHQIPDKSIAFLFDCGGGTTDICISRIFDGNIEVLADNGDALLGGKDFDRLLINHFNGVLTHKYGLNVLETNKKYRLMVKCREIKHTLSEHLTDNLFVDDFKFDEYDVIQISRKEFENLAIDLILRAKNLIAESLRKAKLHRNEINIVFQVGGGCRMPMIKKMLNELFPNAKHQCSIHPEELVAKGAALYAYEIIRNDTKV